jgi:hypothetical protein
MGRKVPAFFSKKWLFAVVIKKGVKYVYFCGGTEQDHDLFVTSTESIFASIIQSKVMVFSHPAFSNICMKQTPITTAPECLLPCFLFPHHRAVFPALFFFLPEAAGVGDKFRYP